MEKIQKVWRSLEKFLSFCFSQLGNGQVLNPLVLITELGHHCKVSRLLCNFSICKRFREEPRFRAALPVCIFKCIMISCLRFFEISSEPSVHHYSQCLQAKAFLSQCVLGEISVFAYRETRFSDHFLLEWSVVLLFQKTMAQGCENAASGSATSLEQA